MSLLSEALEAVDRAIRVTAPKELRVVGEYGLAGLLESLDPITSTAAADKARHATYAAWCGCNTWTIYLMWSANIEIAEGVKRAQEAIDSCVACEGAAAGVGYRS